MSLSVGAKHRRTLVLYKDHLNNLDRISSACYRVVCDCCGAVASVPALAFSFLV
jgi:hypothetical protein